MKLSALLFTTILIINCTTVSSQNPFPEAHEFLEVNNIKTTFSTSGAFFWNGEDAEYFVPKTDTVSALFVGALWMGGLDEGGQLRMAAQTYRQGGDDFWPGPLDANGSTDSVMINDWDKIWRVTKNQVDIHIADFTDNGVINFPQAAIREWPALGNLNARGKNGVPLLITDQAAPFFDNDGDGLYDPTFGDYPQIKGDEMLWYVFNDRGGIHTETGGQPIGAEIQISAYGYNCPADNLLYNTLFIDYKIIHKGNLKVDDFYIGKWVDFDIGCFINDYVGCDTVSNTFYAYNGTATDSSCATAGYGNNPPVQTVTFLNQSLTGHRYYNNDFTVTGNPETAVHFYNYMAGYWKDSMPVTYGGNGYGGVTPTNFMFPGNPSDSLGWSECSAGSVPADRRAVGSIGPFTLYPGTVIDMTIAYTTHFLPFSLCPDFTSYRNRIDSLQFLFDNNLLQSCTQPNLTCVNQDSTGNTCVWPGDANDNGMANIQDVLPIGIGYGDSCCVRPNATTNWEGQQMQDWSQNFALIGTNYKHADCNGDGLIDTFDIQPILDNYGLVHFKGSPSQKTGLPLYVQVQPGPFTAGSTVSLDVFLGTDVLQIPDFYGMAMSVYYNKDVVQAGSVTVDYGNSWAGTRGVDLIGAHKEISTSGRVDLAITRLDKTNRAGFGKVARINYILIDDIAGKFPMELPTLGAYIAEAKAIRNDETEIELLLVGAEEVTPEEQISIYPNPTNNLLNVELPASLQAVSVRLYDCVGKELFNANYEGQKIVISTEDFPEGIYFIEIAGREGRWVRKISVIK